jgi:DNA end-binding protein Ku
MLEPFGKGLLGMTLRYPYEVREAGDYFGEIRDLKLPDEMRKLASHIVDSKSGHFEPDAFVDHYEAALVSLLKAKQAGRVTEPPKQAAPPRRVINLMDALRASIDAGKQKKPSATSARTRKATKKRATA